MFTEIPTPGDLRQGDVVYSWYVPYWNINSVQLISAAGQGMSDSPARALVDVRRGPPSPSPLLIVSGDCEIENPRQRLGILVAPVTKWPVGDDDQESSERLRQSVRQEVDEEGRHVYAFGHLWPMFLRPDAADGDASIEEWMVADFSGITSVSSPPKVLPIFRKARRYEMTDESRMQLQEKLAAFFLS